MDNIDRINHLLTDIGWRYRIPDFRLDSTGAVAIRLTDAVELHLQYDAARSSLYICSPVMPIPADLSLQSILFRRMLELNCLEMGTGFGMTAIHRQTEMIVLQTVLSVEGLQLDALDHALHRMAGARSVVMQRFDEEAHRRESLSRSGVKKSASSVLAAAVDRRSRVAGY